MEEFLRLEKIHKSFVGVHALKGVDFTLRKGEIHCLVGENGCGKSTLIKIISGVLRPDSGRIFVEGQPVASLGSAATMARGIQVIYQDLSLFPNLTVAENLRMATYTGHAYHHVLDLAFAQFPRLGERRKQTAGTLSGGEQQMLSMARALATEPAVLLIDELSMGLAPIIVEELYDHVRRIAASGLSILIVEQFAHEILGLADRAGIMLHGRLLHTGPPASIADELADAYLGADHPAPGSGPSQ